MTAVAATPAARAFDLRGYLRLTRNEVASDSGFLMLVAIYTLLVASLALAIGAPDRLGYFNYAAPWLKALFSLILAGLIVTEVIPSVRANPAEPLARVRARLPELLNPRFAAGMLIVLALILTQGTFTSAKNLLPSLAEFSWDVKFADLDAALHGGKDPWLWLQPILGYQPITRAIQILYTGGWLMALCGTTAAVACSRRLAPIRSRFFLTYLFCWIVLGNIAAGLFMSAGPVYFGEVTGDVARFAAQLDYLSFSEGALHSSYDIQRDLWAIHSEGRNELGSGISAFPSLHIAMATLFMLTGWRINRWLGAAATAFLVIILAGSVHLAWHYAVDGYVSFAVTVAVWFAIGALQRLMTKGQVRA